MDHRREGTYTDHRREGTYTDHGEDTYTDHPERPMGAARRPTDHRPVVTFTRSSSLLRSC
jgi:hypothetical protein